jgi:hypothetical protein
MNNYQILRETRIIRYFEQSRKKVRSTGDNEMRSLKCFMPEVATLSLLLLVVTRKMQKPFETELKVLKTL